ncbi:hypothetical protein GCM10027446_27410 [Angustibacter peucedani]
MGRARLLAGLAALMTLSAGCASSPAPSADVVTATVTIGTAPAAQPLPQDDPAHPDLPPTPTPPTCDQTLGQDTPPLATMWDEMVDTGGWRDAEMVAVFVNSEGNAYAALRDGQCDVPEAAVLHEAVQDLDTEAKAEAVSQTSRERVTAALNRLTVVADAAASRAG